MKENQSRLSKLSQEEIFRQKIALRQCMWGYFLEVNKGKALSEKQRDLIFSEFEKNAEYSEQAFQEISNERSKNSDLISDLRDEAMEIINSRSIKSLKKVKEKILNGRYDDEQQRYLKKLYNKRRANLEAEAN